MDLIERKRGLTRHPWELARYQFVEKLIKSHARKRVSVAIDIGSGDTWMARQLLENGLVEHLTCVDLNFSHSDILKYQGPNLAAKREVPPGNYELVLLLDVLEHLPNPREQLMDWVSRIENSETFFVITVPALPNLYSNHDRLLGHYRRYSRKDFLKDTNDFLEIIECGSFFFSLIIPRMISKFAESNERNSDSMKQGADYWTGGRFTTHLVRIALGLDASFCRALHRIGIRIPGLSHYVIAKKLKS